MKRTIFIIVAVLLVAGAAFYLASKNKDADTSQVAADTTASTTNELPWLPLTQLDGTQLITKKLTGKTILVFFQPDCDHCQREATQIRAHIDAFSEYKVYFVSDAAMPLLSRFAQEYDLAGSSNVQFTQATANDIYNAVGGIQVPAVYVYSDKGRLIKSFIGETSVEQIINYL